MNTPSIKCIRSTNLGVCPKPPSTGSRFQTGIRIIATGILRPLLIAWILALPTGCGGEAVNHIFIVTDYGDAGDDNPGDGVCRTGLFSSECTLRAAIEEANALDGFDGIVFNLPAGDLTVRPQSALPVITGKLILDGMTQRGYREEPIVFIDGSDAASPAPNLLETADGSEVTIRAVQIQHSQGNGIFARGNLTLKHVIASHHPEHALRTSGVTEITVLIEYSKFTDNPGKGIGAENTDLLIFESRITDNNEGGMDVTDGSLRAATTRIMNNHSNSDGGGIRLQGSVSATLNHVEVLNNSAAGAGGGVYLQDLGGSDLIFYASRFSENSGSVGGGLYFEGGTIELTNDAVCENRADSGGGGIYLDGGSLSTFMVTNICENDPDADHDGSGEGGGVYNDGGDLSFSRAHIDDNLGAGIYSMGGSMDFTTTSVSENAWHGIEMHPGEGAMQITTDRTDFLSNAMAGIFAVGASLDLDRSSFSGNGAQGIRMDGGQLAFHQSSLSENRGGGIHLNNVESAEITRSSIWGNVTGGSGGGILLSGDSAPALRLENVTIDSNSAGPTGGGLEVENGTASLNNVTISDNSAREGGGIHSAGAVSIGNSILSENRGGNCSGTITSLGYNLDHSTTCPLFSPGDQPNTAVTLGPLSGPDGNVFRTITTFSAAFDAGDDATCAETDQRGALRPQGAHCDIGAYEHTPPESLTPSPATPTSAPTQTPAGVLFDPVEFSTDKMYTKIGRACAPKAVTVQVRVSPAELIGSVGLFFRLEEKEGTNVTPWGGGLAMIPQGGGWYKLMVKSEDFPDVSQIKGDMWLAVQFIANDKNGQILARSAVLRQVTVGQCMK